MAADIDIQAMAEGHAVVLPCRPSEFRDFISGLLGKPQTISQLFSGSFQIDHNEVSSLHYLINQRVDQQNEASLVRFTAKIVFDDNSSVVLNGLEDFRHFAELKPLVAIQLHLSWAFIVQFQDRPAPEKQEIDISFVTQAHAGPAYDDDLPLYIGPFSRPHGIVALRIKHTARTWGADMESLLSGHIRNLIETPTKFRSFIKKHSGRVGFGVGATFFVASLVACFFTATSLWDSQEQVVSELLATSADPALKLNFIIETISSGLWSRYFFAVLMFLIFSFVAAIFLGAWAESASDLDKPSFLLLTKKSKENRDKKIKKYNRKEHSIFRSIVIGVVAGILANYLFHFMWIGIG